MQNIIQVYTQSMQNQIQFYRDRAQYIGWLKSLYTIKLKI